MFTDNNINKNFKEKGKTFMLIDSGGFTIDITLNEINDDYGNLKQLSPLLEVHMVQWKVTEIW